MYVIQIVIRRIGGGGDEDNIRVLTGRRKKARMQRRNE